MTTDEHRYFIGEKLAGPFRTWTQSHVSRPAFRQSSIRVFQCLPRFPCSRFTRGIV